MIRTSLSRLGAAILALALAAGPALAQKYPDRPVTLIVPWAAGGGTDTVARIFAALYEKEIGQPVNVVNRTGGSGVVGHSAIQTATPDGYTIGFGTSEITYFKTVGLADITPDSFDLISRVSTLPAGLTVKADGPYKTAADVIAAMKAQPKGTLSSSGSGQGGPWHMAIAGLAKAAGLPADTVKWVPSAGGAPALNDLAAGGLSMVTASPVEAKSLSEAGKVKILAVMDSQRVASFPNVPTIKEATGLDWQLVNWFCLLAPKGLPADVRAKIVEVAQKVHKSDEFQSRLKERGITPLWDGSDGFKTFAASYAKTAAELLKDLGIAK